MTECDYYVIPIAYVKKRINARILTTCIRLTLIYYF